MQTFPQSIIRQSIIWRFGALCAAGALGALLAACGGQGHIAANQVTPEASPVGNAVPGQVVFNGNFSDPAQQWPTQASQIPKGFVSGATPTLSTSGNSYAVTEEGTGFVSPIPNFGATNPANLVNVDVSTTVQPTSLRAGDGVGVVCRTATAHAYVFTVGPAAQQGQFQWSITSQGAPSRQLGSGTVAAPPPSSLTIGGECKGGSKQTARQLALSLNGQVIGQATDSEVSAPFAGLAGLRVSSAHGGTSATFSSFEVRAA